MLVSGNFCHCYDVCKQGCSSSRIICNWSSFCILVNVSTMVTYGILEEC